MKKTAIELLDEWLGTRGFIDRTPVIQELSGPRLVAQSIRVLRPHKKEWLATVWGVDLKMTIWGPGILNYGLAKSVSLADPESFDEIATVISAWRKTNYAVMDKVCRYIKQVEHRSCHKPSWQVTHWFDAMSPKIAVDYRKIKTMNRDVLRSLEIAGIDLAIPVNV